MKKSFKRALAAVLAVMMVLTAFPMTAFAKVGDYHPNIGMRFGNFYDRDGYALFAKLEGEVGKPTATGDTTASGIYGVPIIYDGSKLVLKNDKVLDNFLAEQTAAGYEMAKEDPNGNPIGKDGYTLQPGDFFTVTFTIENVESLNTLQFWAKYSDNIEPAVQYFVGKNAKDRNATNFFGTKTEMNNAGGEATEDDTSITSMASQSCGSFYDLNNVKEDPSSVVFDPTLPDPDDDRLIKVGVGTQKGVAKPMLVPTGFTGDEVDPATGKKGYQFQDENGHYTHVLETFVFKITKPGPITIECADTTNEKYGQAFNAGFYVADFDEFNNSDDYTTIAPNISKTTGLPTPGSQKMTFTPYKEEQAPHTHEFVEVAEVAPTCDKDGHKAYYSCTCGDFFSAAREDALIGKQTELDTWLTTENQGLLKATGVHAFNGTPVYNGGNTNKHTYTCTTCDNEGPKATKVEACSYVLQQDSSYPSTCTVPGKNVYKCSKCGHTYEQSLELAEHTIGIVNGKAANCTEAGWKDYYQCSVCKANFEDAKGNTPIKDIEAWKAGAGAIKAKGHDWGTPIVDWKTSGQLPTATITCNNDAQHTETVEGKLTGSRPGKLPTPTEMGETIYTYEFNFTAKGYENYTAENTVVDVPAAGYTYDGFSYELADNGTAIIFTFNCVEDPNKDYTTEKITMDVIPVSDATCTQAKTVKYTATKEYGGVTATYTSPAPISVGEKNLKNHLDLSTGENYGTKIVGQTASTCTVAGYSGDEVCLGCGEIVNKGHDLPLAAHKLSKVNGQAATCETAGWNDYYQCSECKACFEDGKGNTPIKDIEAWKTGAGAIAATGHEYVEGDWTWNEDHTSASVALTCSKLGCEHSVVNPSTTKIKKVVTDATVDKAGNTEYTATITYDGKTYTNTVNVPIAQLESVIINIVDTGYGKISGTKGIKYGENKLAKDSSFTVTATADAGAVFEGWYNGNKLLTTSRTYTSVATNDMTLLPKFKDDDVTDTTKVITVSFVDMWGNIIKTYTDTPENYQNAIATDYATLSTPDIGGYKFKAWDMDEAAIKALDHSQTIKAIYELKTDKFTVTLANGIGTFVTGGDGTNLDFDTNVTVKHESATAWKVNGVIVGYGPEYSFYVGADVTLEAVTDQGLALAPSTTIVKVYKANTDMSDPLVNIVATRNVPDGYTYIKSGMVFGKTTSASDLVIDNPTVHVNYCRVNGADQFLQPYGVTAYQNAHSGMIGARAFVIYRDASGVVNTIYSDVATYDYAG